MPSVNDCSRTVPPPAPLKGSWNASESLAGFRRNHRLECVGIAGWFTSEYATGTTQMSRGNVSDCEPCENTGPHALSLKVIIGDF